MTASVLVLLVEDESFIQEIVEQTLADSGITVVKASNGVEAIAMLEAENSEFDALISDVHLGNGPTGWDVARRARELNENLPVVYMSGHKGYEWWVEGVPNSIFVPKPLSLAQIVKSVSQLLSTAGQKLSCQELRC